MHGFPWDRRISLIAATSVLLFYYFARDNKLYKSWRTSSVWAESRTVISSWSVVFLLATALILFLRVTGGSGRRLLATWYLSGAAGLLLWRVAVRISQRRFRRKGRDSRAVAIAGAGILGTTVARSILNNPWTGLSIYGLYDDFVQQETVPESNIQIRGNLDDLVDTARRGLLDYVYIALPIRAEERILTLVGDLAGTHVAINLIPDRLMRDFIDTKVINLDGIPTVSVVANPLMGTGRRGERLSHRIKRSIDVVSSLLLLLLCLPLILTCSCLLLIFEGRPILYRSERYVSANQKIFTYKFRSMIKNATDPKHRLKERFMRDGFLDIPLDCEVYTPLGRVLEKTQIVELLQLLNVLFDGISLVGNRPLPLENLALLKRHKGWERRFDSPAGITGITQVVGKLSLTPQERLELEGLYSEVYVRGKTLRCDCAIAYYTIRLMLWGKGAPKEKAFALMKRCLERQ